MRRGLLFGVLVSLGVNKEEEGSVSSQRYMHKCWNASEPVLSK